MSVKDKKTSGEPAPESNSQELFNEIFKQANVEIRIEKEGTARSQKHTPVLAPGRSPQHQKVKDGQEMILKPSGPAARTSEKGKGTPTVNAVSIQPAPKSAGKPDKSTPTPESTPKRKAKRSIAPKAALLVLLLAMLAGIILSYLGILDIPFLQDDPKIGHEEVIARAPVLGKQAAIPRVKAIGSAKQPQDRGQNPTKTNGEPKGPPPAPPQASSSGGGKEDKLAELEKPSTVLQATSGMERVEGEHPPTAPNDRSYFPEITAGQESQPSPVQTGLSPKSNALEPVTPKPSALKYPYSVYLGSFRAAGAVKKALSEYYERGLSPYWAKVDLGDKGVWFRFFAGYFQTKEEAEKFIRDRNIQGASLGITKYANLIGIYSSDNEVEDIRRLVESAGFCPYVIKGPSGKSYLYSGAFDRKEHAEKELVVLASKGITSKTTER